jgi:hypothetical protein
MMLDEGGDAVPNEVSTRTTDDVSNEQDSHQSDHEPHPRKRPPGRRLATRAFGGGGRFTDF